MPVGDAARTEHSRCPTSYRCTTNGRSLCPKRSKLSTPRNRSRSRSTIRSHLEEKISARVPRRGVERPDVEGGAELEAPPSPSPGGPPRVGGREGGCEPAADGGRLGGGAAASARRSLSSTPFAPPSAVLLSAAAAAGLEGVRLEVLSEGSLFDSKVEQNLHKDCQQFAAIIGLSHVGGHRFSDSDDRPAALAHAEDESE